jgi:Ni/Co efflux regulator RcnB
MKRTILTVLAGSLAALTLGATAAHAEEWEGRPPQAQQQRDDRGADEWRYSHPQSRVAVRRARGDRDDRYRESRDDHDYRRNARVDVYDGSRCVSIRIGGFFAGRTRAG